MVLIIISDYYLHRKEILLNHTENGIKVHMFIYNQTMQIFSDILNGGNIKNT